MEILFSLIGNRDPYSDAEGSEPGPVLSLLQQRTFDRVYLFYTGSAYLERARTVEEAGIALSKGTKFLLANVEFDSPADYEEVFGKLKSAALQIADTIRSVPHTLSVLLDPGTPQMQTAWFLLVRSGVLPARLLQGVPARFAGGAYRVKEVKLDSGVLPEVRMTGTEVPDTQRRWFTAATSADVIGVDPAFTDVLSQAARVAQYDISVLIRGETGTGKGLIARIIHESSERQNQPFVPLNCAAISPALVESELFGHAKGAFTGASAERLGLFRSANGGTIFLDEVGDLPPDIQPKLLRVLEDRTIVPVGEDREITVDVRVLAATNRNLEELIDSGTFRRDLYERLNQFTLALPPLRDRPDDVPLLVRHYVEEWNHRYHEAKSIDEEATSMLLKYPWPGNVRELSNAIRGMCAASMGTTVGANLLPQAILAHFNRKSEVADLSVNIPKEGVNLRAYMHRIEADFYRAAMNLADGNGEQAARLLGLNGPAFRKAWKERFGGE